MKESPAAVGTKRPSPSILIARSVWLEVTRRDQYLALFILMGLYLLVALGIRLLGETHREVVALMLNMGLWLSASLAAVLTLLTGARLLTAEIETRTIYPLLAKPIERQELLIGKVAATVSAGWILFLLFTFLTLVTWTATFPIPGQDLLMFTQAVVLQLVALSILGTGVVFLSLVFPRSVAVLLGAILYFAGKPLVGVGRSVFEGSPLETPVAWMLGYLPDFSRLCLLQRFTDGAPRLGWGEWGLLLGYGILFSFFLLGLSSILFERRNL